MKKPILIRIGFIWNHQLSLIIFCTLFSALSHLSHEDAPWSLSKWEDICTNCSKAKISLEVCPGCSSAKCQLGEYTAKSSRIKWTKTKAWIHTLPTLWTSGLARALDSEDTWSLFSDHSCWGRIQGQGKALVVLNPNETSEFLLSYNLQCNIFYVSNKNFKLNLAF